MGTREIVFFLGKGSLDKSGQKSDQIIQTNKETAIEDLKETIVFSLSPILGGRSEVLKCPAYEVFGYLKMAQEKAKNERWSRFTDIFYATQQYLKKTERSKYIDAIRPVTTKRKGIKPPKVTDISLLRKLKDRQKNQTGG